MILIHNTPTKIKRGLYNVYYDVPSGSVGLSFSINGLPSIPHEELPDQSTSIVKTVALSECFVTANISGGAQVSLGLIGE